MTERYDALALKNQLCFPIYLCSKEIIRRYTPILEKIDLTYTQYIVMMYLWEMKTSNVKDMGGALLLDSGTLTPILKKLESKGYVKRERSRKDERNLIITLTEKGERLKVRAVSVPQEMCCCFALSDDEAKTLGSLIYKVLKNVQRSGKNGDNQNNG